MFDLARTLYAAAARNGSATAIVDGDVRLTYSDLLDRARRAARGFEEIGLRHGDRLLIVMQNRAEMTISHWAAQLVGLVSVPVNWRANADELEYYLTNSDARAVLFEPASEDAVASCTKAQIPTRISVMEAAGGSVRFEQLLECEPCSDVSKTSPDDISLMLYTSGTTGRGKGVPRRHRAERAAALAHVAQNTYRMGETTLGVMPLYHTMGIRALLSMALINGTFICQPRFDAEEALGLIEREKVSALYLVPTLYHDLVAHEAFKKTDVSSVRKLGFAGATMTEGLLRGLAELFKPELFVNHYGSSEVYTFTIDQDAPAKPGSAGRAGINTEIRVIEIESINPDNIVQAGVEGQVIATLSGDEAFEGYWKRDDASAAALHRGWYFTGDIGVQDEAGDLFVTGRIDDMIITGGENVLPAEIESVLSLHPAVAEVAVAGWPHERWGQQVVAFVRRTSPVTRGELDAWCRESELANFKRPRSYVFVAEIPKSPVGKILRRQLVAGDYRTDPDDVPSEITANPPTLENRS